MTHCDPDKLPTCCGDKLLIPIVDALRFEAADTDTWRALEIAYWLRRLRLDRFGTAVPEHVQHVEDDYWALWTDCTAAQWRAARAPA